MKHSLLIVLVVFVGVLGIVSCSRDRCKDITCTHGTRANTGGNCICTCDTNYLGKYCDTLVDRIRYKFLKINGDTTAWHCVDSIGNTATTYKTVFIGDTSSPGIWMLNFRNYGRTDTLPLQVSGNFCGFVGQVNFGNNAIANLLGTICPTGDTIRVTYYYGVNTITDSCHGLWLKK